MTQEEKDKLFKYLCMALPYKVKVYHPDYDEPQTLDTIFTPEAYSGGAIRCDVDDNWEKPHTSEDCRPYLRSMSSMTEVEKKELITDVLGIKALDYFYVKDDGTIDNTDKAMQELYNFNLHWISFDCATTTSYINWFLAHHFDFMGLIPMGLAIEVTEPI